MSKRLLLLFLLLSLFRTLPAKDIAAAPHPEERPKVGLVLCGGGAKGTAHIGVLKVLEKAGIPIDYIAGTSMGSIIGGLYSIGYTADQLDSIVRGIDWNFLLSDKKRREAQNMQERNRAEKYIVSRSFGKKLKNETLGGGLIRGNNIQNVFSALTIGYHDSIDFAKLPIPFACVAQDIVTGKEVVLKSGVLATAMRASMAVPGAFYPIRKNGMVLIDGGMVNNYPVDVVRAMGADIVIGVDVQNSLKNDSTLKNAGDILGQIVSLMGKEKYNENIRNTDVYIPVDVEGYGATSFTPNAIDSLIKNGQKAAEREWITLRAISLKENSYRFPTLSADTLVAQPVGERPRRNISPEQLIAISRIVIPNMSPKEERWIMKRCGLQENSYVRFRQIQKAMDLLCSRFNYEWVSFRLLKQSDEGFYLLEFIPEQKQMTEINLGARFDSEELASILLNLTANLKGKRPSSLYLTARLGKRYMGEVGYSWRINPKEIFEANLLYRFRYNDINVHRQGKRFYNATYRHHAMEAFFSTSNSHDLRFTAGLRCEFFDYSNFLSDINPSEYAHISQAENERLISYFGELQVNTWDDAYFPTRGLQMFTSYTLTTDNFAKYQNGKPFFAIQTSWEGAIRLTPRFTLLPAFHARLIEGNTLPYSQQNTLGGEYRGRFLPQQLPFYGICNTELADNLLTIASAKFRYRLAHIHYISLSGSAAMNSHDLAHYWDGQFLYGINLTYSLQTPFGPLSVSSEYSNHTDKLNFYANIGFYF